MGNRRPTLTNASARIAIRKHNFTEEMRSLGYRMLQLAAASGYDVTQPLSTSHKLDRA